ncbi:DedA family protein [Diplocloster modestus]|uniref:DedA family protein n=1 Tax=Diplocloster modestus TaxID=2850322 RepID=A0ABS6KE60_9FIRM|nr:DedA family protein [Diplocloster modestus]MBU9728807.1 DedA family protein [Diplocloster modestus]
MGMEMFTQYFVQYGAIAIFVIVLLEYMNMPGFPAGIIMPLAGVWAKGGGISFVMTILLTVSAGLVGSWILYGLGRLGGDFFLGKFLKKFPKHEEAIHKNFDMLRRKGSIGVFISKLLPMVRTLISIPAGVLKMDFVKYTVASLLGVFVWNFFFVGAGYLMGDAVFKILS